MDGLEDSFDTRMNAITDAQAIAALAPWRQSKEVFIIDPDLQELLFGQDEELTINSEILLQIQYQCFYIQFAGIFDFLGYPCHGVFVHLEDDANANDKELRLLYLTGDGYTIGEPIHIDEGTLEESIAHTRMEAFNNVPDEHPEVRRRLMTGLENLAQESAAYKKTLQIILYLCAQNAEIAPDSEQAFITKRSSTGQIRDQYEEMGRWVPHRGRRPKGSQRVGGTKKTRRFWCRHNIHFYTATHTPRALAQFLDRHEVSAGNSETCAEMDRPNNRRRF